jgi:DNA-binding MarR family transcriptional regulator
LTAPVLENDGAGDIGRACHVAADGRRAARALAKWCARFNLSEPEFQVLWRLRLGAAGEFDQTALAKRLAYSPAQVSATVERLRERGWIASQTGSGDRRRNLWRLTTTGSGIIVEMLRAAHELRWWGEGGNQPEAAA